MCINIDEYMHGYQLVLANLFKIVSRTAEIQWITDNLVIPPVQDN